MSEWYRVRLWPDSRIELTTVRDGQRGPSIEGCIAVGDSPDSQEAWRNCLRVVVDPFMAVGRKSPDAELLRSAALIVQKRSKKPKSVILRTLVNVLRDTADEIDEEATAP